MTPYFAAAIVVAVVTLYLFTASLKKARLTDNKANEWKANADGTFTSKSINTTGAIYVASFANNPVCIHHDGYSGPTANCSACQKRKAGEVAQ